MSLSQAKGNPAGVTNGLSFHSDTTRESKIGEIRNNKEDMKSENIKQELWKDVFSFLCKIRYLSTTLQAGWS